MKRSPHNLMSFVIGRQWKIWTTAPLMDVLFSPNLSCRLSHECRRGFATEDGIVSIKIMNCLWWGVELDTVERVGRVHHEQNLPTPPPPFPLCSSEALFSLPPSAMFLHCCSLHGNRKLRDRRMSVAVQTQLPSHSRLAAHSTAESQLHISVIKHTGICSSLQNLECRHKKSWKWKFSQVSEK